MKRVNGSTSGLIKFHACIEKGGNEKIILTLPTIRIRLEEEERNSSYSIVRFMRKREIAQAENRYQFQEYHIKNNHQILINSIFHAQMEHANSINHYIHQIL